MGKFLGDKIQSHQSSPITDGLHKQRRRKKWHKKEAFDKQHKFANKISWEGNKLKN